MVTERTIIDIVSTYSQRNFERKITEQIILAGTGVEIRLPTERAHNAAPFIHMVR